MLKQAFGEDSLGSIQTYDSFKCFKGGRTSGDNPYLGLSSTCIIPENIPALQNTLKS